MNPRHPVYVISKGRWGIPMTARALTRIGVPHRLVVEPTEAPLYRARIAEERLASQLTELPFHDLGQGSIPARNWCWQHALRAGAERHWIIDDNIWKFYRLNRNLKTPVGDGTTFRVIEDFCDRWTNLAQTGMNYFMFAPRKEKVPPLYLNTRVYSCILLLNDLPFRWRGRYNEDTDLSLRILKAGWPTVLFNAFLAQKMTTMKMKGGNTTQLYRNEGEAADGKREFDGRLEMAMSLKRQHPDVVTVCRKWGRFQHLVDYSPFAKNRLMPRPGAVVKTGVDNFGMGFERKAADGTWRPGEAAEEAQR
jgi:hypothetical protein